MSIKMEVIIMITPFLKLFEIQVKKLYKKLLAIII